jgi:hypothetical protein
MKQDWKPLNLIILCYNFRNAVFALLELANPQALVPSLVGCPLLLSRNTSAYPSLLDLLRNPRTHYTILRSDLLTKKISEWPTTYIVRNSVTEQAFSSMYHLITLRRKCSNRTEGKVECKLMSSIHQHDGRRDEIVVVLGEGVGGQFQR